MRISLQPHDRSRYIPLRNQSSLIYPVLGSCRLFWGRALLSWSLVLREQADLVVHLLES